MRTLRLLHKWFGLIVGLQLVLWTVSGLVFAWLDPDEVAGEAGVRTQSQPVLAPGVRLSEPGDWFHEYADARVQDITLTPLLDRWVYRVRLEDRIELRRADDGARFAIDEAMVRALAAARYAGEGALRAVSFHATPTLETRDAGPVWQAAFGDAEETSLYFGADDGRFIAARTDTWRLFDVFWMLHTMDFRGRDDFNHPLVILFATSALWLAITGGLLLYRAFRP